MPLIIGVQKKKKAKLIKSGNSQLNQSSSKEDLKLKSAPNALQ